MIAGAATAFADDGFGVTTRALAQRMGVTQALLYRYFTSKEALIEAVFEQRFMAPRAGPDPNLLEGARPLGERLAAFYTEFVGRASRENVRLFLRAALDGLDLARRYGGRVDQRYLLPVLGALRREAGLDGLPARPPLPAERELTLMLHGALVFTLIRKDVYRVEFPLGHSEIVALHARVYAAGAVAELRRLHGAGS